MRSDRDAFHVTIDLRAERDGTVVAERTWTDVRCPADCGRSAPIGRSEGVAGGGVAGSR